MKSSVTFDNMMPFMGVVENNIDMMNQGRVQVRCFGVHPTWEDSQGGEGVPTEHLPWAVVLQNSKMISVPEISDWVFGFFIDGRDAQHPMVIGTLPGTSTAPFEGVGADGENPWIKPSLEAYRRFGEWPIPPQMSGEGIEETAALAAAVRSIYNSGKNLLRGFGIGSTKPGSDVKGINEPMPVYGGSVKSSVWSAGPPHDTSYIEMGGHEGSQIIVLMHESGSSVQMDQHGNVKLKASGTNFIGSEGDMEFMVNDNKSERVQSSYNLHIEDGDWEVYCGGSVKHIVQGDYELMVGGSFTVSAGQNVHMDAGHNISIRAQTEHINLFSENDIRMEAEGAVGIKSNKDTWIESREEYHVSASQDVRITSESSTIDLKAADIIQIDGSKTYLEMGVKTAELRDWDEVKKPDVEDPPEQATPYSDFGRGTMSARPGLLDDQE